jgi:hypothetical protein
MPVVVVVSGEPHRYVLVDSYNRVRGLAGSATTGCAPRCLPEDDVLLLGRLMRSADADSALEEAWLLRVPRGSRFTRSNPAGPTRR